MSHDVEGMLSRTPTRQLSDAASERIARAVLSATPAPGGWRRPVPLWQVVAACLVTASVTVAWTRHVDAGRPPARSGPVALIALHHPLFQRGPSSAVTDVSRWRPLTSSPHGD